MKLEDAQQICIDTGKHLLLSGVPWAVCQDNFQMVCFTYKIDKWVPYWYFRADWMTETTKWETIQSIDLVEPIDLFILDWSKYPEETVTLCQE